MAITALPVQCKIQGTNVHFEIGGNRTPEQNLEELRTVILRQPNNISLRVEFAKLLNQMGHRDEAITEAKQIIAKFPNAGDAHHELGHFLEQDNPSQALIHFQRALDVNPSTYRNYRCYGRCLGANARTHADPIIKRATLEKSKRLLQRAAVIGGEKMKQQIDADLFVIDEALAELPPS
jgi:tetratricopeptide (TPR) repeat protein